jgi:hypothetical protein
MTAAMVSAAPTTDMLAEAIGYVRSHLVRGEIGARLRCIWAGAKAASDLGAADVIEQEFLTLAKESGIAADLRNCPPHPHDVEATLRHVIRWAMRGMNAL